MNYDEKALFIKMNSSFSNKDKEWIISMLNAQIKIDDVISSLKILDDINLFLVIPSADYEKIKNMNGDLIKIKIFLEKKINNICNKYIPDIFKGSKDAN